MLPPVTAPARLPVPPLELLGAFLYVGATAMGGGASAHIHAAVVRRRGWLTEAEFLEGLTLAQLLPGPNISNMAAYVGSRLGGPAGALAATVGMVLPGTLVVIGLALAYFSARAAGSPALEGALNGVAAAAAGVVWSVVLRVAPAGLRSRGGLLIAAAAFVMVGVLRLTLPLVLALLFPLAIVLNRPRAQVEPADLEPASAEGAEAGRG